VTAPPTATAPASPAPAGQDAPVAPAAGSGEAEHGAKKLLARGSIWATVNYVTSQVIRLGSNIILWRLLSPQAFGLMALVYPLIVGLAMFSDIGIGQSVVQNPRG